jgi:hypothetical protein
VVRLVSTMNADFHEAKSPHTVTIL